MDDDDIYAERSTIEEMMWDEDPLPRLIEALTDENRWLRYYAAQYLGTRDISAAPALIKALKEEPWALVRLAVAEALGKIGVASPSPEIRDALTISQARDVSGVVREFASNALRGMHGA